MSILATLALLAPAAAAQSGPGDRALPNFHQVNDHLYRGAQPAGDGIKRLAAMGVKTVIDLRSAGKNTRREKAEAEAVGLRYFNVPLPNWGRPDDRQIEHVLALMAAPENWPVLVHCRKGADRTGTVIAAWRISHDGWDADRARQEARSHGMSWTQFWMKDYISDYARAYAAAGHAPGEELDDQVGRGMAVLEYGLRKGGLGIRWFFGRLTRPH